MKQGPVEIVLINPADNSQYVERRIDGKTYFVAVPGQEYHIKITINNKTGKHSRTEWLRFDLRVDGQCVGYYIPVSPERLLNDAYTYTFNSFNHGGKYCALVFADAVGDVVSSTTNKSIGTLDVKIYSCTVAIPHIAIPSIQTEKPKISPSEGKKFWQQPSASTAVGRELGDFTDGHYALRLEDCTLLYHVEIPYHTAGVLNLMAGDARRIKLEQNPPKKRAKKEKSTKNKKGADISAADESSDIEEIVKTREIPLVDLNEIESDTDDGTNGNDNANGDGGVVEVIDLTQ